MLEATTALTDADGEPWFNVNDVCAVVGYAILSGHVSDDYLTKHEVIDSLNRKQHTNYIHESGLSCRRSSRLAHAAQGDACTPHITLGHMEQGATETSIGISLALINASRLHPLIFASRKPDAERFHRGVASKGLPSIR